MIRAVVVGFWLALAACQPTQAPALDKVPPMSDACGAAALQALVGQDRSVLDTMTLPAPNRVIAYGRPVTMDYSEGRLNILLGKDGRIRRVHCG